MDFKSNKKLLRNYKGDTRSLILINTRLKQIEDVFDSLGEEDRKAAEMIFFDKTSQISAECYGLSKAAYYNVMNKVIFLTAREMDLI